MVYIKSIAKDIIAKFDGLVFEIRSKTEVKDTISICNYIDFLFRLTKTQVRILPNSFSLYFYERIKFIGNIEILKELIRCKIDKKDQKFIDFIEHLKSKTKLINTHDIFNRIIDILESFKILYDNNRKIANNLFNRLKSWLFFKQILDICFLENLQHLFDKYLAFKENRKVMKRDYKLLNAVYPRTRLQIGSNQNTLRNGLKYKIYSKKIVRKNKCESTISFDSETYKGCCKLLCDSNGKYILSEKGKNITFDDCLMFLAKNIDKKNVYRTLFNIDFDIQAILKLYHKANRLEFVDYLSKGITLDYKFVYRNKQKHFKLTWLRGRMFKIQDIIRKRNVIITDLYLFVKTSLDKAGKKYLKEHKKYNINAKLLNTKLSYWYKRNNKKEIKKKIIKYCIQDCKLTSNLTKLLCDSIIKAGLELPKYLVSYASLSKQNFRYQNFIPSLKHVPIKIIQIAFDCYYGGRFEVFKRGFFEKGFLYDINSQYPNYIKDLPDLSNGFWIKKKFKYNELPKEQCLGYFECQLNIPEGNYISTVLKKKGIVRFPNGFIWSKFTWFDLDLVRDFIVSDIKAYIFIPNKNNFKPFYNIVNYLFDKKKEFKSNSNSLLYIICKFCLNAFYGCNIERNLKIKLDDKNNEIKKLKAGVLFNPIYASQITAFGRWSVIKDIPKSENRHILGIHTDSIISDIEMDKFLDIGNELGQWSLEKSGKTLIINTGMYQIDDLCKSRGIPKSLIKNDLFKFAKKHRTEKEVKLVIRHMKKIREALVRDKSIEFVNTMSNVKRSISINSDTKGDWIDNFKDFNDLLSRNIESLPLYTFKRYFDLGKNPIILAKQTNQDLELVRFVLENQAIC